MKPKNPKFDALEIELLAYLNETPELLSLLYDIDLLPEQLNRGSRKWVQMLMIIEAWKRRNLGFERVV